MTLVTREFIGWQSRIEAVAKRQGLDFFPIIFDIVDWDGMAEVTSYHGFPDHFSHWKFGEAYINTHKSFSYGLSKIYEIVVNTNPALAYLLSENKLIDQKIVMAHVCAHVDFFKNNAWFKPTDRNMLARSRAASERIERYRAEFGEETVSDFITDCMKIQNLIDCRMPYMEVHRGKSSEYEDQEKPKKGEQSFRFKSDLPYLDEFINPRDWVDAQAEKDKNRKEKQKEARKGLRFPAKPVRDVLLFLLRFAPLEEWQRDILDIIRQESYYFLPQALTKIANEGWAAYWHSKLMVERGLAPSAEIADYAQHNAGTLGSSGLNPYKLGLAVYLDIEHRWDTGRHGELWEKCRNLVDRKASWDDFVVFKNIHAENAERVGEEWAEWCAFKRACEEGLHGFPKDLFAKEKLVKWWCDYQQCEDRLVELEKELNLGASPELTDEIGRDLNWFRKLLGIKIALQSGEVENTPDPIPEVFLSLAEKHPGVVSLGQGRNKIFEIRHRISDYALIDEFFTPDLFEKLPMFSYKAGGGGVRQDHWGVDRTGFKDVKKKLLFTLFNRGEPLIEIVNGQYAWSRNEGEYRGTGLYLKHRHEGADLKRDEMEDTLYALFRVWQNPVYLETVVTKEEKRSSVPPEILRQMGAEPPHESKRRGGQKRIFFTLDGEETEEFDKELVNVDMPY